MLRAELDGAVRAGIITAEQADRLTAYFTANGQAEMAGDALRPPQFDLAHALWYLGALVIMGAMGLFSTLAFGALGGKALLVIAMIYAVGLWFAGDHLWHSKGLKTPGGLLITAAVAMAPLALFALFEMFGWRYSAWGWLPIELGTLAACLLALRFYRFPFIVFVAAVTIWFMSMDVADILRGKEPWASWELRRNVSLIFGLVVIPFAWWLDVRRKDADFGFWLHIVGAVTFFSGLSMQKFGGQFSDLVYCLICLAMIGFGVFLSRRVYAVFGAIGLLINVSYLTWVAFKDVMILPFVMSALGIAMIWLGLKYHRNAEKIGAWFDGRLPEGLKRLRPQVRG